MVVVAVHGSASRFLPAERGTVHLTISLEGEDRATVVRQVGALHERFVGEAKAFVEQGVATWWGSAQVWARSERRYIEASELARTVQVASAEVRVRFQDFATLSAWIERTGSEAGVVLHGVEWSVSDERHDAVTRGVRVEAVRDAMQRAEAYASAIGGTGLALQALWEPGLRPGAAEHGGGFGVARAMSGRAESFELRPDDIEIAAAVTADFAVELA